MWKCCGNVSDESVSAASFQAPPQLFGPYNLKAEEDLGIKLCISLLHAYLEETL